MSGPGDRAFVRWAKRYVSADDGRRILAAYRKAGLVEVDNRAGTFRILDRAAATPEALEAAAENLRPSPRKGWNHLTDAERERLVARGHSVPEQWERQEAIELAIARLDARKRGG